MEENSSNKDYSKEDKISDEAFRIVHSHIAMGGDYEDFEGMSFDEIVNEGGGRGGDHMTKLTLTLPSPEFATTLIGIMEELRKAESQHEWPETMDLFQMLCIMNEEAGEATKAALDFHNGTGTEAELKTELMQTAAMCLRVLNHLNQIPCNKK